MISPFIFWCISQHDHPSHTLSRRVVARLCLPLPTSLYPSFALSPHPSPFCQVVWHKARVGCRPKTGSGENQNEGATKGKHTHTHTHTHTRQRKCCSDPTTRGPSPFPSLRCVSFVCPDSFHLPFAPPLPHTHTHTSSPPPKEMCPVHCSDLLVVLPFTRTLPSTFCIVLPLTFSTLARTYGQGNPCPWTEHIVFTISLQLPLLSSGSLCHNGYPPPLTHTHPHTNYFLTPPPNFLPPLLSLHYPSLPLPFDGWQAQKQEKKPRTVKHLRETKKNTFCRHHHPVTPSPLLSFPSTQLRA